MALRLTRALLTALPKATPAPTRPTKPTILEVERKFRRLTIPTLTATTTTTTIKHTPPFRSVLPLPTTRIHDIYYDTPTHALCTASPNAAWIRTRDGAWEAKLRRGGDFVNSRFEEVRGADAVARCIAAVLGRDKNTLGGGGAEEKFGLEVMAEFVTTREEWLVDGEFRVVRDRMDFGHEVGEVELQVEVEEGVGEREKGAVMEEMDRRIGEFMRRYGWAWEEGKAVGKLTAYFEMVKAKGVRDSM